MLFKIVVENEFFTSNNYIYVMNFFCFFTIEELTKKIIK